MSSACRQASVVRATSTERSSLRFVNAWSDEHTHRTGKAHDGSTRMSSAASEVVLGPRATTASAAEANSLSSSSIIIASASAAQPTAAIADAAAGICETISRTSAATAPFSISTAVPASQIAARLPRARAASRRSSSG